MENIIIKVSLFAIVFFLSSTGYRYYSAGYWNTWEDHRAYITEKTNNKCAAEVVIGMGTIEECKPWNAQETNAKVCFNSLNSVSQFKYSILYNFCYKAEHDRKKKNENSNDI